MDTEKLRQELRQAVQADPAGQHAELLNRCYVALGEQGCERPNCGCADAYCKAWDDDQPAAPEVKPCETVTPGAGR